jgi:phosphopantetheine adenylyltransferase
MKLTDYKAQSARHILVYGPPKSGKTAAVGKLASKYKLWYFDLEDSVKTLLNPAMCDPAWLENIELFRVPDKQTYPMGIETMLKVLKGGTCVICHLHGKVSCPQCARDPAAITASINVSELDVTKDVVVVESYSQLAESAMNYIMRDAIAKDNFDAKAGWDEYGKQGRILERIGSTIQVAPYNIIVVSHETMVEMEDGSKKIVPIGGTSNASKVFAKYFDDVVYCEIVNKTHRLVSSSTAKANVLAGSRGGVDLKPGDTLLKLFE